MFFKQIASHLLTHVVGSVFLKIDVAHSVFSLERMLARLGLGDQVVQIAL